jgi:phosphopantothenoylcysteine decarboxylase / phosphopantothenate---cysteine ligase
VERHTVVLGVTGSIAAYKSLSIASSLVQQGVDVRVIMSTAATKFVAPLSFESVTNRPVLLDLWTEHAESTISHIRLAEIADVLVIAPATANTIAALALGLAPDALTSTALACRAPLLVAPAMNTRMWEHPATQGHVATLRDRGATIIGPATGYLAEGTTGEGRLAEPEVIVETILSRLGARRDFAGQRFVVSAGPTHEAIDPVRYLSNRSSGKMGYAIAEAAARRGAEVTLVSGPTRISPPPGVTVISVTTAEQMFAAIQNAISAGGTLIMAAAVADYKPAVSHATKLKRKPEAMLLTLAPTVDILGSILRPPGLRVVAFAAETENLLEYARSKLTTKRADMLVANDVSEPGAGFEGDTNHVWICKPGQQPVDVPLGTKRQVAEAILDALTHHD